jgi:arylsulfatase A-like enzyme
MTGLYPPAHGVRDNGNYALGPQAVTLAERLGAAGYHSGAFVSAAVLTRRYGLDQGFDTYDDLWSEDEPPLFMIRERPAPRTADRVLAWLDDWKQHPRQPFFVWCTSSIRTSPTPSAASWRGTGSTGFDASESSTGRSTVSCTSSRWVTGGRSTRMSARG